MSDGETESARADLARVHFWTREVTQAEIDAWDPDREPGRYPTLRGHGLYELYWRLARRGYPVSIGRRAPVRTAVLITSLECVTYHFGPSRPADVFALHIDAVRVPRLIVIRGDVPPTHPTPSYAAIDIAPNPSRVDGSRTRWIPFLPQRGLRPRAPQRGDRVDVVALKCYPENVPEYIEDGRLGAALAETGVELRIQTGPDQWPDFSDVDAVLCVRRPHPEAKGWAVADKPPTKLINAWCAGVIPIVGPEPAYIDLVEGRLDAVPAATPDEIVAAIAGLRADPATTRAHLGQAQARGAEYSLDLVLSQWIDLLWRAPIEPRRREAARELLAFCEARLAHGTRRAWSRTRWGTTRALERMARRVLRRGPQA